MSLALVMRQHELEAQMTQRGIQKYRANLDRLRKNGSEAETSYGGRILQTTMEPVVEGIQAFMEAAQSGKPGRRHEAVKYLMNLDPEVVAFLTLKAILNSLTRIDHPMTRVCLTIGGMIEDEVRLRSLREQDDAMFQRLQRMSEERVGYAYKRKLFVVVANKEEIEWEPWSEKTRVMVGSKLLDIVMAQVGLVEPVSVSVGGSMTYFLRPLESTVKMIEEHTELLEIMRPQYEPMIVPPALYEPGKVYGGGYLTRYVRPVPMVKLRGKGAASRYKEADMPAVYDAINSMSAVPFCVNRCLLAVITQLWEGNAHWAGIPKSDWTVDAPVKPEAVDTDEQARKDYRSALRGWHEAQRSGQSRRVQFLQCLDTATRYAEFDQIFIPYQMDYRGRVYAVPNFNPQGPDHMKALLQFAEGKPLGEEGAKWLAISLANHAGVDKVSLADRVAWVYANEDIIVSVATNPYDDRRWVSGQWRDADGQPVEMKIDKPFQFLAAALEWKGYVEQGPEFVSHLPIHLDGSCSGIQHYSMALRDPVGGRYVNLVPGDKPEDIYQRVADVVTELVKADLDSDAVVKIGQAETPAATLATQWLTFGITRKVCKRPVMTFPYSSGQYGYKEQIMEDVLRAARSGDNWPFEGDGFKAAVYLAGKIEKALPHVVVKAAEGMRWLRSLAGAAVKSQTEVKWVTPVGFPVSFFKPVMAGLQVKTIIGGEYRQLKIYNPTDKLDRHGMTNAVSPNFIHSLDAAHLQWTVVRAVEEGITNLALIHDSFGTLAADTPRFFVLLRETLAEVYHDRDVFAELRERMLPNLSEECRKELPPAPNLGDLEVVSVLESDYAFA